MRFDRREGMPVTIARPEDGSAQGAIREVDLQRKYHWSAKALAERVGLTAPKSTALRRHLGIYDDDDCRHDFVFSNLRVRQYSDNALTRMRSALETVDMDAVWAEHRPRPQP